MSVATGRQTTDVVYLHLDDNICVAARNLSMGWPFWPANLLRLFMCRNALSLPRRP